MLLHSAQVRREVIVSCVGDANSVAVVTCVVGGRVRFGSRVREGV